MYHSSLHSNFWRLTKADGGQFVTEQIWRTNERMKTLAKAKTWRQTFSLQILLQIIRLQSPRCNNRLSGAQNKTSNNIVEFHLCNDFDKFLFLLFFFWFLFDTFRLAFFIYYCALCLIRSQTSMKSSKYKHIFVNKTEAHLNLLELNKYL